MLIDDFYVPCLQEATSYDRAVGYFSSALYHVLALAFSDFVRRGGHMRPIWSPALTPEDFAAMKEADQIGRHAQSTVRADLEMLLARPEAVPATKLLATLIANGIIDVRIAFADHPSGIFHDRWASSRTARASGLASSAAPTRPGEPGASITSLSRSFTAGRTRNTCCVPAITPILSGSFGVAAIRVFGLPPPGAGQARSASCNSP